MSNFTDAYLKDLTEPNNWDLVVGGATAYEEAFKRLSGLIADGANGIPAFPQEIRMAIDNLGAMYRLLQKVNAEMPLRAPPVTPEDLRFLQSQKAKEAQLKLLVDGLRAAPTS